VGKGPWDGEGGALVESSCESLECAQFLVAVRPGVPARTARIFQIVFQVIVVPDQGPNS